MKSTTLLLVGLAVVTGGALALFLAMTKPESSSNGRHSSALPFPDQAPPPMPDIAPLAGSEIPLEASSSHSGPSSLNLLQKEPIPAPPSRPSEPPPQAPAYLPQAPPGAMPYEEVAQIMSELAALIRRQQPQWHQDFMSQQELSQAAQRYFADKDFLAYLQVLAGSAYFNGMLTVLHKTTAMKKLTGGLFADKRLGPRLSALIASYGRDRSMALLLSRHGAGLVPKRLLEQAGVASAPRPASRKKLQLKPMQGTSFPSRSAQPLQNKKNSIQFPSRLESR